MNITRISEDGVEPVTLDEAKDQCYIPRSETETTVDAILNSLCTATRIYGENRTWLSLIDSTWEYRMDEFPNGIIEIPRPPLIEISSIKYISGGTEKTVSADDYTVDVNSTPGRIEPDTFWPNTDDVIDAVRIRYTAGFGDDTNTNPDESTVPEDIKIALRMGIKFLYDNRDSYVVSERSSGEVLEMPIGTNAILDNNAVRKFA